MFSYISISLFLFYLILHPVHVSIINMDIKSDEKKIYFSVRLFHDDLGLALYNEYHDYMHETQDSVSSRDFTDEYIKEKFIITCEKCGKLNYLLKNKEIMDDSVIMTYSCELKGKSLDKLLIQNFLFLELYSDQKNLVIINKDGIEKGYTLSRDENFIELLNLD